MLEFVDREWRVIPSYPDYEVSNFGEVRSNKRKKQKLCGVVMVKTANRDRQIVPKVSLHKDKKIHFVHVARCVLEAFFGYLPKYDPCIHIAAYKDGDSTNVKKDNLYWKICETTPEFDPSVSKWHGVCRKKSFTPNQMALKDTYKDKIKEILRKNRELLK